MFSQIKRILKQSPRVRHLVRRVGKWKLARQGYPDWQGLLARDRALWDQARRDAQGGPKVLIATSVGGHLAGVTMESLLAAALTLRGADVHLLLCDALLPACLESEVTWFPDQRRFVAHGPARDLCGTCFSPGYRTYEALGLPIHRYSALISPAEMREAEHLAATLAAADIPGYTYDGLAAGEHALAGALRFYARATLAGEPHGEAVLRRYFRAALLTIFATRRLLGDHAFTSATFHHGIYVPQGLIGEVARQAGVRVVNWNPSYRKQTFIFSHHTTYHHTLMTEPTGTWEHLALAPATERELMAYLKSRWQGTDDWIWFHDKPQLDTTAIASRIGVDFSRPCIGMLTNVMWDAQLHYPANAFANMLDWVLKTIAYFAARPELQLLIRVHPAELRGTLRSRQPIAEEIARAYPVLPGNVFVIPPESDVSTYAAMMQCNAVIIYGTKTGVELTSMGKPTLVAGEAWIRGKGLTMDAGSVEEYFRLLDGLPLAGDMDPAMVARARQYAYHFFFRRMIPVPWLVPNQVSGQVYRLELPSLRGLLPSCSPGLDVICDGILAGRDFIFPHERYAATEPPAAVEV